MVFGKYGPSILGGIGRNLAEEKARAAELSRTVFTSMYNEAVQAGKELQSDVSLFRDNLNLGISIGIEEKKLLQEFARLPQTKIDSIVDAVEQGQLIGTAPSVDPALDQPVHADSTDDTQIALPGAAQPAATFEPRSYYDIMGMKAPTVADEFTQGWIDHTSKQLAGLLPTRTEEEELSFGATMRDTLLKNTGDPQAIFQSTLRKVAASRQLSPEQLEALMDPTKRDYGDRSIISSRFITPPDPIDAMNYFAAEYNTAQAKLNLEILQKDNMVLGEWVDTYFDIDPDEGVAKYDDDGNMTQIWIAPLGTYIKTNITIGQLNAMMQNQFMQMKSGRYTGGPGGGGAEGNVTSPDMAQIQTMLGKATGQATQTTLAQNAMDSTFDEKLNTWDNPDNRKSVTAQGWVIASKDVGNIYLQKGGDVNVWDNMFQQTVLPQLVLTDALRTLNISNADITAILTAAKPADRITMLENKVGVDEMNTALSAQQVKYVNAWVTNEGQFEGLTITENDEIPSERALFEGFATTLISQLPKTTNTDFFGRPVIEPTAVPPAVTAVPPAVTADPKPVTAVPPADVALTEAKMVLFEGQHEKLTTEWRNDNPNQIMPAVVYSQINQTALDNVNKLMQLREQAAIGAGEMFAPGVEPDIEQQMAAVIPQPVTAITDATETGKPPEVVTTDMVDYFDQQKNINTLMRNLLLPTDDPRNQEAVTAWSNLRENAPEKIKNQIPHAYQLLGTGGFFDYLKDQEDTSDAYYKYFVSKQGTFADIAQYMPAYLTSIAGGSEEKDDVEAGFISRIVGAVVDKTKEAADFIAALVTGPTSEEKLARFNENPNLNREIREKFVEDGFLENWDDPITPEIVEQLRQQEIKPLYADMNLSEDVLNSEIDTISYVPSDTSPEKMLVKDLVNQTDEEIFVRIFPKHLWEKVKYEDMETFQDILSAEEAGEPFNRASKISGRLIAGLDQIARLVTGRLHDLYVGYRYLVGEDGVNWEAAGATVGQMRMVHALMLIRPELKEDILAAGLSVISSGTLKEEGPWGMMPYLGGEPSDKANDELLFRISRELVRARELPLVTDTAASPNTATRENLSLMQQRSNLPSEIKEVPDAASGSLMRPTPATSLIDQGREAGEEVWENLKTQDRWITDPLFQSLPWRENN